MDRGGTPSTHTVDGTNVPPVTLADVINVVDILSQAIEIVRPEYVAEITVGYNAINDMISPIVVA
jgi:2-keto-4-pentenoate hydratase